MSSPVKGYEFSTATSGTERKRGFVGMIICQSEPFILIYKNILLSKNSLT